MTTDKGIFIQNIYYMLSYAYQVLQQQDYQCIASEKFERIDDLFAAIRKGCFPAAEAGALSRICFPKRDPVSFAWKAGSSADH